MAEQAIGFRPVYAVIFIDAIQVKIREGQVANRPIYLALGVTVDGERDVLGLWAGEHGDGEGAKYWLRVLSEIKNRGVADVCLLVCDGLKGLPDAVSAVWEKTIALSGVRNHVCAPVAGPEGISWSYDLLALGDWRQNC